ncbi:hypothetical protein HDU82_003024 [Entophlyctis luteolus]|nr:hypothetical protein HDU82_003024 [Entophlyctis luteolus]
MGLLSLGTPLEWHQAKTHASHIRTHGIRQFLNIWESVKTRRRDRLLWGDEIEYIVVTFDADAREVKLDNRAYDVLLELENKEKEAVDSGFDFFPLQLIRALTNVCDRHSVAWSFKPEYGRYMLEGTPSRPYGFSIEDLLQVESNMRQRQVSSLLTYFAINCFHNSRAIATSLLSSNEALISMTSFPLLGVNTSSTCSFLDPPSAPTVSGGASNSLFVPDEAINPHPRFRTLTQNIRERRGSKVAINVPIFRDKNTPNPFLEAAPASLPDNPSNRLPDSVKDAKPDHIYMDCMCFGMGCCCLQVTFQACSVEEARKLYDHLAVMTPIMMTLSAGAPIFRGYLADVDCRWDVISASVDDRTEQERSLEPLTTSRFQIPKSRYASISTYLSPGPNYSGGCLADPDVFSPQKTSLAPPKESFYDPKYNDIPLVFDKDVYKELVDSGIDDLLAKHYAHLFIRDPLVVFVENLNIDDKTSSDHFENIQSTNWQTMRFKPPPPNSSIGWRVEFRSMEIQLTDFENAAFSIFVVLLTRTILYFDLNLYIPLTKVDLNMSIGQKRNAVLDQKFHFRKNIFGNLERRPARFENFCVGDDDDVTEFSVDELINGKADVFPGFIPLIRAYLSAVPGLPLSVLKSLNVYLDFISKRAAGTLPTNAKWMREFVLTHADYKGDSVVGQSIAFDLLKRIDELGKVDGQVSGLSC